MENYRITNAFFNLGTPEILIILLIVLLLFGAKRLPELARGLGQGIREFKGAVDDAKKDIEKSNNDEHSSTEDKTTSDNKSQV